MSASNPWGSGAGPAPQGGAPAPGPYGPPGAGSFGPPGGYLAPQPGQFGPAVGAGLPGRPDAGAAGLRVAAAIVLFADALFWALYFIDVHAYNVYSLLIFYGGIAAATAAAAVLMLLAGTRRIGVGFALGLCLVIAVRYFYFPAPSGLVYAGASTAIKVYVDLAYGLVALGAVLAFLAVTVDLRVAGRAEQSAGPRRAAIPPLVLGLLGAVAWLIGDLAPDASWSYEGQTPSSCCTWGQNETPGQIAIVLTVLAVTGVAVAAALLRQRAISTGLLLGAAALMLWECAEVASDFVGGQYGLSGSSVYGASEKVRPEPGFAAVVFGLVLLVIAASARYRYNPSPTPVYSSGAPLGYGGAMAQAQGAVPGGPGDAVQQQYAQPTMTAVPQQPGPGAQPGQAGQPGQPGQSGYGYPQNPYQQPGQPGQYGQQQPPFPQQQQQQAQPPYGYPTQTGYQQPGVYGQPTQPQQPPAPPGWPGGPQQGQG